MQRGQDVCTFGDTWNQFPPGSMHQAKYFRESHLVRSQRRCGWLPAAAKK